MDRWCQTRLRLSRRPGDLVSFGTAAAYLAASPHPMSERDLRRRFKAAGGLTWKTPGVRGEQASLSEVLEFHRDLHRGWLQVR
jgi:hypothetical protein